MSLAIDSSPHQLSLTIDTYVSLQNQPQMSAKTRFVYNSMYIYARMYVHTIYQYKWSDAIGLIGKKEKNLKFKCQSEASRWILIRRISLCINVINGYKLIAVGQPIGHIASRMCACVCNNLFELVCSPWVRDPPLCWLYEGVTPTKVSRHQYNKNAICVRVYIFRWLWSGRGTKPFYMRIKSKG